MSKKKGSGRAIKRYVPSTLELEKIIENNPPAFGYKFDLFIQIIHLMFEIPLKNKKIEVINGFVPLQAKYLQKYGKNYHEYLKYLIGQDILEVYNKGQYFVGERSRAYRLSEKYMDGKLKEVEITNPTLIRHIEGEYYTDLKTRIRYDHLYQWWNENLTIDSVAAFDYCNSELQKNKIGDYYGAYTKASSNKLSITLLHNHYTWFKVDDSGNRLHTNLTNFSKSLKPFVKYDGQELVSVDVKNSQPYLSIKLIEQFYSIKSSTEKNNIFYNNIMIVKQGETIDTTDVDMYRDLVVGGRFYEYLIDEMKREWGDSYFVPQERYDHDKGMKVWSDKSERDLAKSIVFAVFFSSVKRDTPEKQLFRKLFPNVMRVFDVIKADDHSRLACELQRLEASVILDEATKQIAKIVPEIPLYTIHDSIVTTVGNEQLVTEIMSESFFKRIGYPPMLQADYWRFKL